MSPLRKYRDVDDALLIDVCHRFLAGAKTTRIKDDLNEEWQKHSIDFQITREEVYPLLQEARERGMFSLRAPLHAHLRERLADLYELPFGRVRVLSTRNHLEHLAAAAADRMLALILELGEKKEIVHIGLGAGWTTMVVARHLARLLQTTAPLPRLCIHALSSGFDARTPITSPIYIFGFFADIGIDVDFVGLFAPAFVDTADYEDVKESGGVKVSFDYRKEIDIVVTSLARADDEHGDLNRFMRLGAQDQKGAATLRHLEDGGWLGDAQFRPFNATEPIDLEQGNRAVVLFELEDLVELAAAPDKHVLLVAGPCNACGKLRSSALQPLLTEPKLRIWSELLLDVETARALVN